MVAAPLMVSLKWLKMGDLAMAWSLVTCRRVRVK